MPYNEQLDLAVGAIVEKNRMEKKKMFGGTCYLLNGKLTCGVWKDWLILRLGEEKAAAALKDKKFHVFDITGKPMKGWAMIRYKNLELKDIRKWVGKAKEFVLSLKK